MLDEGLLTGSADLLPPKNEDMSPQSWLYVAAADMVD